MERDTYVHEFRNVVFYIDVLNGVGLGDLALVVPIGFNQLVSQFQGPPLQLYIMSAIS